MSITARQSRNRSLVQAVREGQQATRQLLVCEIGLDQILNVASLGSDEVVKFEQPTPSVSELMGCVQNFVDGIDEKQATMFYLVARRMGFSAATELSGYIVREMPFAKSANIYAKMLRQEVLAGRKSFNRIIDLGDCARRAIFDENRNLILKVVSTHAKGNRETYDRLLSVAVQQFFVCVDSTYDPGRGEFSTYAVQTMNQKCLQELSIADSLVRLPPHKNKVRKAVQSGEISVYAEEIEDPKQRRREQRFRTLCLNVASPASFDANEEDDGIPLSERVCCKPEERPEIAVERLQVSQCVNETLESLGDAERRTLQLRTEKYTLDEVADILSKEGLSKRVLSTERIRQIERDGKKKFKRVFSRRFPDLVAAFKEMAMGSRELKKATDQVREWDDDTCQCCGSKENPKVHHIIPTSEGGEMYDCSNMITVCECCSGCIHAQFLDLCPHGQSVLSPYFSRQCLYNIFLLREMRLTNQPRSRRRGFREEFLIRRALPSPSEVDFETVDKRYRNLAFALDRGLDMERLPWIIALGEVEVCIRKPGQEEAL